MSEAGEIRIHPEPTPNPMTMKLISDRTVLETGSADFPSVQSAAGSPLAEKLFQIPGVAGVYVGRDFVTITKNDLSAWNNIVELAIDGLRSHLASGEPAVGESQTAHGADDNETAQRVREILDNEIRPAVAMDGGDITFVDYKDGVVRLSMRGACAGCPSSTMTLKMGIERRLQEEIPEIEAVEAV